MVRPIYPLGKIQKAEEGVTKLGTSWIIDPVTYVVGLLNENWDPSHVDNREVVIDKGKNWLGKDYQDVDYILVYPDPGHEKQVGFKREHSNHVYPLTLQFLSVYARQEDDIHFQKLVMEARRIILNKLPFFTGPGGVKVSGPSYPKWGTSESPSDRIARGHTRKSYGIEIRRRWARIITDPGV